MTYDVLFCLKISLHIISYKPVQYFVDMNEIHELRKNRKISIDTFMKLGSDLSYLRYYTIRVYAYV